MLDGFVAVDAEHRAEVRVFFDHLASLIEDDTGLIFIRCCAVDLSTFLMIEAEKKQGDARCECALAILPRHLKVGGAILAQSILAHCPEQVIEELSLPFSQGETRARPLALGVL